MNDRCRCPWKGERFDTKEDTEKLVAFLNENKDSRIVDLSGNTYSIDASSVLADALQHFKNLEELICSDFFTTRLKTDVPISVSNIINSIKSNENVKTVDFSHNAMGAPGTQALLEMLNNKNFTSLRLSNCGLGPNGALALTQYIRELAGVPALTEAQIPSEEDEKLNVEICEHTEGNDNISLSCLLLGRNRFKEPGAYILAKGLEYLPKLTQFEIFGNSIPPSGVATVLNALKFCPNIEILDVHDNTFKEEGAEALVELLPLLPNLKHLNLEDCALGKEGVKKLIVVLSENNPDIEYLNLNYCEIDSATCDSVIECIKAKSKLKKVEMNGNALTPHQISAITKLLEENDGEVGSFSDNEEDDEDDEDGENGGSDDDNDDDA